MKSATIIIPTLNEEGNIDTLLENLGTLAIDDCALSILFVDDQSTDNTVSKIKYWQRTQDNVSVLERQGIPDLTQSVIDGATHSSSDFIVVMDADLSHPFEQVPALLKPLLSGTHDIVVGSRYIKGGGVTNWPISRRFLSWFGGLPARIITDVKDTTSGFFACSRSCFEKIEADAKGYKILLELLVAGLDEFRVTEAPILFTDRVEGQSKLSSKQLVQYVQRLLELSGGSVSSTSAKRFLSVGLLGVVIDALIFYFLLNSGWSVGNAHITSFFVAAASNYFFNSIWSFEYTHYSLRSWISKAVKYIFFALIALTVRGGVLAISINLLNIPPSLAIYPAILMATAVNYFGASFIVFPKRDSKNLTTLSVYWRVISIAIIGFMLVLRFLYLGTTELIPDEAYYWNYKEHLDLAYLDHPPLIAWAIWLFTYIFGDNEFGVRIFSFICGCGVLAFIFHLTALLFDRTSAYIAALLVAVLPFSAAPAFLATTDAPTMLFWSACLFFVAKILKEQSSFAWIGIGISIGLGMLSKYSVALLAAGVVIFTLADHTMRKWLTRPIVYLAALVAIMISSPVLLWNYQNDWSSFAFQTTRRFNLETSFSSHYLILHTLILVTPLGLYLYVTALLNSRQIISKLSNKLNTVSSHVNYFLIFTFVPLSVYLYYSFSHYPRFHWTAPAWLALVPLAAFTLSPTSSFFRSGRNTVSRSVVYTAGILCLLYGALFHYAALGLPVNTFTRFTDHYFWKQVAARVHELEDEVRETSGKEPLIVGLSKWSVASSLRYYDVDGRVDNIVSRNAVNRTATMFGLWTSPEKWRGHPVIFVAINPEDLTSTEVRQHSLGLKPSRKEDITLNNNKLRNFNFRIADQYRD